MWRAIQPWNRVITSYSIHYTKLYDELAVATHSDPVQFREGGILIVKAPKETHAKIRELLDGP